MALIGHVHAVRDRFHDDPVGVGLENVLLAAGLVVRAVAPGRGKGPVALAVARDAAQLVRLARLADLDAAAGSTVPVAAAGRVLGGVFAGFAEEDRGEEGQ